jgi:radical SAM superfamily enzyme YgiQ (UPF0313 family)
VNGIAFKTKDGTVIITTPREQIKDLYTLPFPARKKVNLERYFYAWKRKHGVSAASISTMRGCPYTCKWCSRSVYGLSYRRRSPHLVADEIEWITTNYEVDTLWFVDDVFTISHKWLAEFALEVKTRGLKIKYECITRSDRMNAEVIEMLKTSGCFRVWIGAESGSQRVIDLMDRRVEVEQVRQMIRATREAGLQAGTFIMVGYPGETEKDILETAEHLKRSDPDHFTVTVAYPIKGTELYEEIESLISNEAPWEQSTDREITFKRNYSRKYYHFAVRYIVNEVNSFKAGEKRQFLRLANCWIKSRIARGGMFLTR